jgi:hypothetical protein
LIAGKTGKFFVVLGLIVTVPESLEEKKVMKSSLNEAMITEKLEVED